MHAVCVRAVCAAVLDVIAQSPTRPTTSVSVCLPTRWRATWRHGPSTLLQRPHHCRLMTSRQPPAPAVSRWPLFVFCALHSLLLIHSPSPRPALPLCGRLPPWCPSALLLWCIGVKCLLYSWQAVIVIWPKRPHRRRTWTVQSYSPGCANVQPIYTTFLRATGPRYSVCNNRPHVRNTLLRPNNRKLMYRLRLTSASGHVIARCWQRARVH